MKKYIIIGVVLVVALLFILLLLQNRASLNNELTKVGNNVSPNIETSTEVKPINNANNNISDTKKMTTATLHTNKGEIKIEFYDDSAPKTVANFTKLIKDGFYNGVKFHRVIKGFMIQGGDPLSKDDSKVSIWGTGDPGYKFNDEIDERLDLYAKVGYRKGVVAMANSGPNTNGSQFFIMHEDYPLPPLYTIFGKVVAGQEVVDKIAQVAVGPNDRPVEAIIINSIKLE